MLYAAYDTSICYKLQPLQQETNPRTVEVGCVQESKRQTASPEQQTQPDDKPDDLDSDDDRPSSAMLYNVSDHPSFHITLILGFQVSPQFLFVLS